MREQGTLRASEIGGRESRDGLISPPPQEQTALRSAWCWSFRASCLFFLVGLFGNAGPGLLLGNRQLDVTGVLQGCLRRERLRSFLEETHL